MANFTVLFCTFCTRCDNVYTVTEVKEARKISTFLIGKILLLFLFFWLILLHGCAIIESNRQTRDLTQN